MVIGVAKVCDENGSCIYKIVNQEIIYHCNYCLNLSLFCFLLCLILRLNFIIIVRKASLQSSVLFPGCRHLLGGLEGILHQWQLQLVFSAPSCFAYVDITLTQFRLTFQVLFTVSLNYPEIDQNTTREYSQKINLITSKT